MTSVGAPAPSMSTGGPLLSPPPSSPILCHARSAGRRKYVDSSSGTVDGIAASAPAAAGALGSASVRQPRPCSCAAAAVAGCCNRVAAERRADARLLSHSSLLTVCESGVAEAIDCLRSIIVAPSIAELAFGLKSVEMMFGSTSESLYLIGKYQVSLI